MFDIKLLRASTIGPRRVLAGTDIKVDASTAFEMIRSGQGRLVDESDLGLLIESTKGQRPPPSLAAP
jgi:hypothetical protein